MDCLLINHSFLFYADERGRKTSYWSAAELKSLISEVPLRAKEMAKLRWYSIFVGGTNE